MTMDKFIVVSRHPEDIHDGRSFGPGEEVDLSVEDQKEPHNAAKIEAGLFQTVPQETAAERKAREKAEAEAAANTNTGGDA
jgi:hypothetical protein